MGRWKVWVKEGTWRVLAYYATKREADRAGWEAMADGTLVRVVRDGSDLDRLTYRQVHDEGGGDSNAQA